jgi:hypothetical protein
MALELPNQYVLFVREQNMTTFWPRLSPMHFRQYLALWK